MSKMRRILAGGDKGFTLIELLVVIAVLGILAAIAIPRLGGVTDKARLSEAKSLAGSLRSAQEMYFAENNSYDTFTTADAIGNLSDYIDAGFDNINWEISSTDATTYSITISGTGPNAGLGVTATPGGVKEN